MDPQLGRFITPDTFVQSPADPQSFNRYAYCRNNPIKFTDPTGNFLFFAFLVFVAHVATVVATVTAIAATIAQLAGANRLASTLSKISTIASYVSMGANFAGAISAPGSPQQFVEIARTHNDGFDLVTYEVKQTALEGTREAFKAELNTQLKYELKGAVMNAVFNSFTRPTASQTTADPSYVNPVSQGSDLTRQMIGHDYGSRTVSSLPSMGSGGIITDGSFAGGGVAIPVASVSGAGALTVSSGPGVTSGYHMAGVRDSIRRIGRVVALLHMLFHIDPESEPPDEFDSELTPNQRIERRFEGDKYKKKNK